MTTGWQSLHLAAPNQTFVTSNIRTIFADAKIDAGDDCSAAGMAETCDEPAYMLDREMADGETPFADGLDTM